MRDPVRANEERSDLEYLRADHSLYVNVLQPEGVLRMIERRRVCKRVRLPMPFGIRVILDTCYIALMFIVAFLSMVALYG